MGRYYIKNIKVMDVLDSLRLGGAASTAAGETQPGEGRTRSSLADEEPAQLPPSEGTICPRCGEPIRPGYNACAYCGLSLNQKENP